VKILPFFVTNLSVFRDEASYDAVYVFQFPVWHLCLLICLFVCNFINDPKVSHCTIFLDGASHRMLWVLSISCLAPFLFVCLFVTA
jgi:hypothetical protein